MWLKNSEGSMYSDALFLLPFSPFFDFEVGRTATLWTSETHLVLRFEHDCDGKILLTTSSVEAEIVNFLHAAM